MKTGHARFRDGPDRRRALDAAEIGTRTKIGTLYAADCRAFRDDDSGDLHIVQPNEQGKEQKIMTLSGSAFSAEAGDDGSLTLYHHSGGSPIPTGLIGDRKPTADAGLRAGQFRVQGLCRPGSAKATKDSPPRPHDNPAALAMQRRHEELRAAEKAKAAAR